MCYGPKFPPIGRSRTRFTSSMYALQPRASTFSQHKQRIVLSSVMRDPLDSDINDLLRLSSRVIEAIDDQGWPNHIGWTPS